MSGMHRREWMALVGAGAAAGLGGLARADMHGKPAAAPVEKYERPALPYALDALEPHIDAQTMQLHSEKHHQGYVNGLNAALEEMAAARDSGDYANIQKLSRKLAFHGSGHVNHVVFFDNMGPADKVAPPQGALLKAIEANFGSFDKFQEQFFHASKTVAGSGWGLLAYEPLGRRLVVGQLEKHQNQMMTGLVPLLMLDVWEHAYYLKYQNRRGDYIKAFMQVVNWENVAERLDQAVKATA